MGRAGIRPRKKRHRRPELPGNDDDAGIIADLEDQAPWSSYAQDIPRLGDPRREAIRWARIRRTARGLQNPSFGRDWWVAVANACGVGLIVIAAVWGILVLLKHVGG